MRQVLVLAAVTALAVARPEVYREKEDFQYSRSSSDEGSKSGFYGAQRGNMGGNYERAHNMDTLAQHQMGGLVRTVNGELGDGAQQKSGSVFSAANSRGVYGSGHYDLSNLEGRNFQEGTSFGGSQLQSSSQSQNAGFRSHDSHLHSSLASQTAGFRSQDSQLHSSLTSQNAGYGNQDSQLHSTLASQNAGLGSQGYSANHAYGTHSQNSLYRGYQTNGNADQAQYATNTHSADNLQSASQYDAGTQAAQNSGYYLQTGYQGQSTSDKTAATSHLSNAYGSSNTYGSNVRLVSTSPVRVYVRPGGRVAIPLAAQTADVSHGSASTFDHNSINSEAEVLGTNDQHTVYKPNNNAKHYETSYSYRKEWEKHDTKPIPGVVPLAVPTVNPYPSNSELYEDTQTQASDLQQVASGLQAQNQHTSNQYSRYNVKTGHSSQSRSQSAYNAQQHSAASDTAAAANLASSSDYTHGAHTHGASANVNNLNLNSQVENFGSKPKSYQSSYSYHKSWERQGDPYVIEPATNGLYTAANTQASQRLTASSLNQGASGYGHQYDARYHQGQQGYSVNGGADCDEHGHIRVARSYNLDQAPYQSQSIYVGQESQNLEDLNQQSQNLEEFGQQPQHLEDFGQESQNLEDFGQQSQKIEDFGQQSQKLEDFGQQPQKLDEFGQQSQSQVQEEVGQQVQNKWDQQEYGQQEQIQFDRTEDLGQRTQNQWDQQSQTDLGQETQNTWNTRDTIQNGNGKNNEQKPNGMEHTGYINHGTNTGFEQQESVFEINHPSNLDNLNQRESHITPEDDCKQNPLAHTIFDKPSQERENRDSSKTDIEVEKEFTQTEDNSQHTQIFWNQFPTNMNHNNSNDHRWSVGLDKTHPEARVPDWQHQLNAHHIHLNTGSEYSQHNHYLENTGINIPKYADNNPNNQNHGYVSTVNTYTSPWMFAPSNGNNADNFQQYHGYGSSVNSYTNTQSHYSRNDYSTHSTSHIQVNPHVSDSTSLTTFWDLIDGIEKQATSGNKTESFDTNHSYHHENKENTHINSNTDWTQKVNENTFNNEFKDINLIPQESVTNTSETTTIKQNKANPHNADRADTENKQTPRDDIGRGDIGPEDAPSVTSNAPEKPLETFKSKPVLIKPYKTPEEIETLSLTKETGQQTVINGIDSQINVENYDKQLDQELSVLSLGTQKQLQHHNEHDNWKLQNDIQRTTSTTPRSSYNYLQASVNVEQGPKEIEQQNTDQQSENLGHVENLDQQSYNQFENGFAQQSVNLDQQNVNNQMVDFGQQSENLGQKHVEQQLESFNEQTVNLNHPGFDLEHGPDEIQQQNMDQQFETLGQPSKNINQQSLNQVEDLGQNSENLGQASMHLGQEQQQLNNLDQQSEGFQQQNINDFGQQEQFQQESLSEFGQQNENQQAQTEQQLENWGQQNENLEQQSQIEDLNQQLQTMRKPNEDLHQESPVETFVPPPPPAVYHKEGREPLNVQQREPVVEPEIVTKKSSNVDAPPEPVTEKVGFWKNVGSKFAGAKDKVASWFSRS